MWIAIAVPVMVVALCIAVLPLLVQSIRYHNWQHRRLETGKTQRPIRRREGCPQCGVVVQATGGGTVDAAMQDHTRRRHGALPGG